MHDLNQVQITVVDIPPLHAEFILFNLSPESVPALILFHAVLSSETPRANSAAATNDHAITETPLCLMDKMVSSAHGTFHLLLLTFTISFNQSIYY